ncbi:glycosyltransferase family 2 protein [Microbacterium sp. zg.Y909]|uniref:glycosyltransferase family 2 protein n=1 Tax=Microbacterium sp. zg.Y909 TaxID=2969413 RepID=UPI00214C731D|nr:glycosyltransferase family 2 protein [Microbacterium sp. zg.Y909]MCR2823944.1 glycosyltransferase family 2 protein [Microbacterium sp. zg.Y909]
MSFTHITVVMPAYNEAPGIAEFISEIRDHVAPLATRLDIIVADDRSTDATAAAVAALGVEAAQVQTQARNRGHGPTALAAYRAGLDTAADVIVHVDGDGQFEGADLARVLHALQSRGVDVVHGVRRGREDPWYRRALSFGLRLVVRPFAGRSVPDINTPLRAYRPDTLRRLIDALGPDAVVPHVHFSLAEARFGMRVAYVPVRSLPRRGGPGGTMWGAQGQPKLPPKRLRSFVRQALRELWQLSLRRSAPMRQLRTSPADRPARVADAA